MNDSGRFSELIYNSIFHLLNFEKYSSFQMAAREAAVSNNFQLVLMTEDFNVVFSVETRHTTSIENAVRLWLEQDLGTEEKNTKLDVDGVVTYWGPIGISGVKYYLMLVDNERNFSQDDIVKLAEIIELAIGMWNYRPERDPAAELIRSLRRGNRALAFTLLDELGVHESDCRGVFFIQGLSKSGALSAIAAFEKEYGLQTVKAHEGEELAGILLAPQKNRKSPGAAEWNALAGITAQYGADRLFHLEGTGGIEGMCSAFKLINETEAFAGIVFPRVKAFGRFELVVVENCVNLCMTNDAIKKDYTELLKPFSRPGDQKNRQLADTLAVFILDSGFSAAGTAEILGVHVNTVQYRLKRIREILGAENFDPAMTASLMTALAVSRIEREVKSF